MVALPRRSPGGSPDLLCFSWSPHSDRERVTGAGSTLTATRAGVEPLSAPSARLQGAKGEVQDFQHQLPLQCCSPDAGTPLCAPWHCHSQATTLPRIRVLILGVLLGPPTRAHVMVRAAPRSFQLSAVGAP
ncbi:unnamed protein product [Lepidochelys olivacea]